MGVMNKLIDLFGPKPVTETAPRTKTSGVRDYQIYKAEAEANGDVPDSPEVWAKKR